MSGVIDLPEVLERVQDDKELLLELFDIFIEDFADKRSSLGQAIDGQDIDKVKEVAHSLKGASGNISAKDMHANCIAIEQDAKDGKFDGLAEKLTVLDQQFDALKQEIDKIKQEFSG